jgi:hypothetical protein
MATLEDIRQLLDQFDKKIEKMIEDLKKNTPNTAEARRVAELTREMQWRQEAKEQSQAETVWTAESVAKEKEDTSTIPAREGQTEEPMNGNEQSKGVNTPREADDQQTNQKPLRIVSVEPGNTIKESRSTKLANSGSSPLFNKDGPDTRERPLPENIRSYIPRRRR